MKPPGLVFFVSLAAILSVGDSEPDRYIFSMCVFKNGCVDFSRFHTVLVTMSMSWRINLKNKMASFSDMN